MTTTLRTWPTFPSSHYFDQTRYEQELAQIWYRNWLYLCRADAIKRPKTYRTFVIGNQNVVILRDEQGRVQAFHNTCRHRGSILCEATEGEFSTRSIVCPYHNWSYSLQGELKGVPFIGAPEKLGQPNLALYDVPVREWGGCIFVNLDKTADTSSFAASFDPHIDFLANWPLADIAVGYTFEVELACNWKIFWENFQECYHCPGIHPELCDMVPLYKRAVSGRAAARELAALGDEIVEIPKIGMREGASTWSMDGEIHGRPFHNLTEEEKRIGYKYLVGLPNWFMAAHPDYIRLVSLFPASAETMQLKSEWLFPQETLDHTEFDLMNVVDFGKLVLEQDGAVCELNQRGLRSQRHAQGILLPQEEDVHLFLEWVRGQMGEPLLGSNAAGTEGWQAY